MRVVLFIMSILLISGCAPTTIMLDVCKNDIYFDRLEALDQDTIDNRQSRELSTNRFALLYPAEVKLNKVLLENELKCTDLKKVEIEVQERFGLFNKIILRF